MTQLGRRCPPLLKTVKGRPHATNRHHEPDVKREEYKETTEAEVNQSPRSSISDGKFSTEDKMSPDARSLSKLAGYAADTSTSPLKHGSATREFDPWETGSQRKRDRNTYRAGNNYAPSRAAKRKPTGRSDNTHGADHRQGNKRKRSPSNSTQGTSFSTCLCRHFSK